MILVALIIDVIGWIFGWANEPPKYYDHTPEGKKEGRENDAT